MINKLLILFFYAPTGKNWRFQQFTKSLFITLLVLAASISFYSRQNLINADGPIKIISIEVSRGDTISELMLSSKISPEDINKISEVIKKEFPNQKIQAGDIITFKVQPGANNWLSFAELELKRNKLIKIHITKDHINIVKIKNSNNNIYVKPNVHSSNNTSETISLKTHHEEQKEKNKQTNFIKIVIESGDTIEKVFRQYKLLKNDRNRAIHAMRKVFNPRKILSGQAITLITINSKKGKNLQQVVIQLRKRTFIDIRKQKNGFYTAKKTRNPEYALMPMPTPSRPNKRSLLAETNNTINFNNQNNSDSKVDLLDRQDQTTNKEYINLSSQINPSQDLVTFRTRPGDTLASIISNTNAYALDRDKAISLLREEFNPRHLRVGQEVSVLTELNNKKTHLLGVSIKLSDSKYLEVLMGKDGSFNLEHTDRPMNSIFDSEVNPKKHSRKSGSLESNHNNNESRNNLKYIKGNEEKDLDQEIKLKDTRASKISPIRRPIKAKEMQFALDGAEIAAASPMTPSRNFYIGLVKQQNSNQINTHPKNKPIRVSIEKGEGLSTVLKRAGISSLTSDEIIKAFRKVYDPRKLQIGQTLEFNFSQTNNNGVLEKLTMNISPKQKLIVERGEKGNLIASQALRSTSQILRHSDGKIESSLYLAAKKSGLPIEILMEVVHIFGFAVDWQRDVQSGDHFSVLYEVLIDKEMNPVGYGSVIFASLTLSESETSIFRYEFNDGSSDYFEENGKSVRRALMRTPINGARLSSGYGMRRHPVQGYNKMHRGLDFAAPTGTPIMAAGDGKIDKIGRYNSYGKYIRIRHNSTYSTAYAHLSRYAKNLKRNSRVKQGQVIGYVGSTGRSTGPHLHYEILSNGKQINPSKVKLPSGRQLKTKEIVNFHNVVRKVKILLIETSLNSKLAQNKN